MIYIKIKQSNYPTKICHTISSIISYDGNKDFRKNDSRILILYFCDKRATLDINGFK